MHKILFNTIVLYVKIMLNMALSFISVPIILRALGAEDYGLYTLVAGVISMLAFLNNSMTVSTQRYLSVTMGSGNVNRVKEVFSCSIYLHVLIGILVCLLFELGALFAFNGFLNIPMERIEEAKVIYQFLVLSTFFTIISVPYDAALNAHENMLVFSLITILGAFLRLGVAISLLYINADKLIVYGVGLACIVLVEVLLKRMYVSKFYKEMVCLPYKVLDKSLFREMFVFAGWNTFGTFAGVCRNQGLAIVLNLFYGTIVNAAYGVANQVNGVLSAFSGSLQKAINPQLMQQEGANQRGAMLNLSFLSIKISVLIFALMAIPLIIEMKTVLNWWLKQVPEYTVVFCQLILVINLLTQMSVGIMTAVQAGGKIALYQFTMGIIWFLNLPLGYLCLRLGYPPYSVLIVVCIMEIIALFMRLWFAYKLVQFPVWAFVKRIFSSFSFVLLVAYFIGLKICFYMKSDWLRLSLVVIVVDLIILLGTYLCILSKKERIQFLCFRRLKK